MQKDLTRLLASGLGAGYSPFAPGTAGTLVAILPAYLLYPLPPWAAALVVLAVIPASSVVCGIAAGERGEKDPGWIVLDEIAGFLVATIWLEPTVKSYLAAFFLFRLFDILKPPPAGWIDRSGHGGWSIVGDDVAAGIFTRISLYALARGGVV